MKEWSNPYNSFNSYKGLIYKDWYDGIIKKKLLPPVEVNIDPCNNCQLSCVWCNSKKIIDKDKLTLMDSGHLLKLVDFCADWGVKAICYAGGGEPTLHKDLAKAIKQTVDKGMECAIITNGLFLDDEQIESVAKYTKWCGVSVDCSTPTTYEKLKGKNKLGNVLENIRKLVKLKTNEVTYKFLVHPDNQTEIFSACLLAKELGCNGFHLRMLANNYCKDKEFNYTLIENHINACRSLETETFKVYTIQHKQEGQGNRRIKFNKCQASPLLCMLEANGDVSVCIDRKGESETRLCGHEDLNELKNRWGSQEHFDLLEKICPDKDCPKCTMTIYQELLEAYKTDKFCWRFP